MDGYGYVVNVEGAVVRDDAYLVIERGADEDHAPGSLAFPGGKVETPPGGRDPIESTARRELREEVGVDVSEVEYVLSSTFETDDGTPVINVVTLCTDGGGDVSPRASDEVSAVHWLTADEIAARNPPSYFERNVEELEAYRRETTRR